jgi:hypothetical protein
MLWIFCLCLVGTIQASSVHQFNQEVHSAQSLTALTIDLLEFIYGNTKLIPDVARAKELRDEVNIALNHLRADMAFLLLRLESNVSWDITRTSYRRLENSASAAADRLPGVEILRKLSLVWAETVSVIPMCTLAFERAVHAAKKNLLKMDSGTTVKPPPGFEAPTVVTTPQPTLRYC